MSRNEPPSNSVEANEISTPINIHIVEKKPGETFRLKRSYKKGGSDGDKAEASK